MSNLVPSASLSFWERVKITPSLQDAYVPFGLRGVCIGVPL